MLKPLTLGVRRVLRSHVERLWIDRQFPEGNWIESFGNDRCMVVRTTAQTEGSQKQRFRFEVDHPSYRVFVFYGG